MLPLNDKPFLSPVCDLVYFARYLSSRFMISLELLARSFIKKLMRFSGHLRNLYSHVFIDEIFRSYFMIMERARIKVSQKAHEMIGMENIFH